MVGFERVCGVGIVDAYGRAAGGILRNPVAGVVGGRAIGSPLSAAAVAEEGGDELQAAAKRQNIVWADLVHLGEKAEEAKEHRRIAASASEPVLESSSASDSIVSAASASDSVVGTAVSSASEPMIVSDVSKRARLDFQMQKAAVNNAVTETV